MKRIKDVYPFFETLQNLAVENNQLLIAFLKDNKLYVVNTKIYEKPERNSILNLYGAFYALFGKPEIIELASLAYLLDEKKARKRYGNMSTTDIYQKIIKKYGSLSNSPYFEEGSHKVIYTEKNATYLHREKLFLEVQGKDRRLSSDNSNLADPYCVIEDYLKFDNVKKESFQSYATSISEIFVDRTDDMGILHEKLHKIIHDFDETTA